MSKKITKLTPEQEALLDPKAQEWIKIGLSTAPLNFEGCVKFAKMAYKADGLKEPSYFYRSGGPRECAWMGALLKSAEKHMNLPEAIKRVGTELTGDAPDDCVLDVDASAWPWLRELCAKLQPNQATIDGAREQLEDARRGMVFGNHDVEWLAYCDFFKDIGLVEETRELEGLWGLAKNGGWSLQMEAIVIFQERPCALHTMEQGGLHCETGPAIAFPDKLRVWALNDVVMEQWMVETPEEELTAEAVLKVTNVEQRRELIRKVSIDRLLDRLHYKVLDEEGDYALLSVDLAHGLDAKETDGDLSDCRFLKMKNPSIGVFHVEGVAPDCGTVQEANNWRAYGDKNKEWKPSVLT